MYELLRVESLRLSLVLGSAFLLSLLVGNWSLICLLAFSAYVVWHVRQLSILLHWLWQVDLLDVPEQLTAFWREIASRVIQLRRQVNRRRKKLARRLRRLERIMEAMPDAAVLLDSDYTIAWFNSASILLLGVARHYKGSRIDRCLGSPAFSRYLADKDFSSSLELLSPVDPMMSLEVRVVPWDDDHYLVMAHDITEMRRLQLIRQDFIANASHELRTPLTVISGYLEMLETEDVPAHVKEALQASNRQAHRMERIVTDLLMLSQLEAEEVSAPADEVVDVPALLSALKKDAEELSGDRRHSIVLAIQDDCDIKGSERELASAFGNLIFNAVTHTPAGTNIDISWRCEKGGAELIVEDDGTGVPPEHLARLTERFYRVDRGRSRDQGGTGLGLSIVKHVLQHHGGSIQIESQFGSGSRFICQFPASRVTARP